jgi:putative transcriptional regulator
MNLPPAAGRLLVAANTLLDDNFHRRVVLLCSYEPEQGALGLVLNHPSGVPVGDALPDIAGERREQLWIGGPVDGRSLWMLHRRGDLSHPGQQVLDGVWFGAEGSVIRHMLQEGAPDPQGEVFRLFVGYAGWAAGQLEEELRRGAWAVVPAGAGVVFSSQAGSLWAEMQARSLLPCCRQPELLTKCWLN